MIREPKTKQSGKRIQNLHAGKGSGWNTFKSPRMKQQQATTRSLGDQKN